ncbi:MAG: hypothetical protein M5U34_09795 [Chloroflexi bacterium]|nr:hypothetical protein [Chloroflexota bacterium]
MSENQRPNEVSVDRREETAVTQQPGYAGTEQVTRNVVAEGRPPQGTAEQMPLGWLQGFTDSD